MAGSRDLDASALDDFLLNDVALLTGLHDAVLHEAGAGDLVGLIDRLTSDTTRAATAGDPGRRGAPAGAEVADIVDDLDAEQAADLARALTVHLHLTNLADERHRARMIRGGTYDEDPQTAEDRWPAMTALGHDLLTRLDGLRIHPVLTAHPTEARRRAVASGCGGSASCSTRYDDQRAGRRGAGGGAAPAARGDRPALAHLAAAASSRPPHRRGPHGDGRVRRDAVPGRPRASTARSTTRCSGRGRRPARRVVPAFLRFGTWVGGDRDGNPFVTAAGHPGGRGDPGRPRAARARERHDPDRPRR